MILETILRNLSVATFMERYFLKVPYSQTGGCGPYTSLADWSLLDAVLPQMKVDVIVGRQGAPYIGPRPTSAKEVRALLGDGYTVGIRDMERYDQRLGELAAGFRYDLASPVDIHLYCTPAGQPGFGWHYDAEDVFIFQCSGSKEWRLRKNSVNPWPLIDRLPLNMRYEREIMPMMRCRLEPEDWLYIPGGYWHCTEAGEESISLSIGVQSLTAMDVHDFLRTKIVDSLRWRQRLPSLGAASGQSGDESVREYQALCAELGQDLAKLLGDETFAREFIRAKHAANHPESAK